MPFTFDLENEKKEIQLLVDRSTYKLLIPQFRKCKEEFNCLLSELEENPSKETMLRVNQSCAKLSQVMFTIEQLTRNDARELIDFLHAGPICEDSDSSFVIAVPDGKNGYVVEELRLYYYRKIVERFVCQSDSKDVEEEAFEIQRCKDKSVLLVSNENGTLQFNFPNKLIPIAKLLGIWVQNKKKLECSPGKVKTLTDVRIRFNFNGPVLEIAYLDNGVEKRFVDEGSTIIENFSLKTYQLFALIGDSNLLDLDPNNQHFRLLKCYYDMEDRILRESRKARLKRQSELEQRKESTLKAIEEECDS